MTNAKTDERQGPTALSRAKISKKQYPSGAFSDVGGHLHDLSTNASVHVTPAQPADKIARLECIVVPTSRSVTKNRKNIIRILQLAGDHGATYVLFLCSGAAKRADVVRAASGFNNVSWIAVDGPFVHEQLYDFKTTKSPIACGSERDLAHKRNFALQLARLMGWESIFLLDDDLDLQASHLAKAANLLKGDSSVVGFSAREYPDHSVVMHASRWAHAPIDAFVGGGALAIKTSAPYLSFFPHVYNDDWLFLLLYCLLDQGGLTWAGTITQKRYNPFKHFERAKSEEPGDLLAESLMRLAMAIKTDRLLPPGLNDTLASLGVSASKEFWEHEISERILFIRNTQDALRHKKIPSRKKRQALRSLSHSLATLTGEKGLTGLRAEILASWTNDWIKDNASWNKLLHSLPKCNSIEEAFAYLRCPNAYTHNYATASYAHQPTTSTEQIHIPAELEGLPRIPRSPQRLKGLHSTKTIETLHRSKGMSLQSVIDSTAQLRFDRPVEGAFGEPTVTVGILVANGESEDVVSKSIRDLQRWLPPKAQVQVLLWVYALPGQDDKRLHRYRDSMVARIVPEIIGTNLRLRSMVLQAKTNDLDHLIDDLLVGAAMAYWLNKIEGDHQVFVVNSKNELLRKGTFWEFVRQEHSVPSHPLQTYLQQLPQAAESPDAKAVQASDDQALTQARRNLATAQQRHWWPKLSMHTPTAMLVRSMKRARLSWLEVDDLSYEVMLQDVSSRKRIILLPDKVHIIPVAFNHTLTSDIYASAKDITDKVVASIKQAKYSECVIVVYSKNGGDWQELLDFRKQLMDLVKTRCERPDIVFTSLVYHPEVANTPTRVKLVATANIRYFHWLVNYQQKPTTYWHKG